MPSALTTRLRRLAAFSPAMFLSVILSSRMPLDLTKQLVLRWDQGEPPETLLKLAGVDAVLQGDAEGLITRGQWPGIRRAPNRRGRGDETASASREPWVDANGYLVALERALKPGSTPVLGYKADAKAGLAADRSVPYETLALALVEARVHGGNYVLSLETRYREALLKGEEKALAAWKRLGETAAWLRKNAGLFGHPAPPAITVLVDRGMATSEIANLLHRRNGSPRLAAAGNMPAPDPTRILALMAASLNPANLNDAAWDRVWAHARAGTTVVIDSTPDPSWKLVKEEEDRRLFALGGGHVLAYKKRVADPSEFALDVIDIVNHRRRPARLWNANAAIALATSGRQPGEGLLHVINYGSPVEAEVQARVQGQYKSALLMRPEGEAKELKTYSRGSATEIFLPELSLLACVIFR